jgi:hypothetical protein
VEKDGGGGEGLIAKNSARIGKASVDEVSQKLSTITLGGKTQKTKFTKCTKYTSAATVKSSKSVMTTAGLSLGGKSYRANGSVVRKKANMYPYPVLSAKLDKPIGGSPCMVKKTFTTDSSNNPRCHLTLIPNNEAILVGATSGKRAETDENTLKLLYVMSSAFTDENEILEYLLPSYMDIMGCNETIAKAVLMQSALYLQVKNDLKKLHGNLNEAGIYPIEQRIMLPFKVSEDLVSPEEDPLRNGCTMEYNDKGNLKYIHLEVKQDGEFIPVSYDAGDMHTLVPDYEAAVPRKGMFGAMSPIPASVNVRSNVQSKKDDDSDNSSLDSDEQKSRLKKSSRKASRKANEEEDNDAMQGVESSGSNQDNFEAALLRAELESQQEELRQEELRQANPEVAFLKAQLAKQEKLAQDLTEQLKLQQEQAAKYQEELQKQLAEQAKEQKEMMNKMWNGEFIKQSRSKDSQESGASGSSSPKKLKGKEGQAASSSESVTSRSIVTRGSIDRAAKRNSKNKTKQN